MREIKFRGQHENNPYTNTLEWTYGDLLHYNDEYFMNVFETEFGERAYMERVIKKSVGQFTGLHDKNGKEIYEGDIIEGKFDRYVWRYVVKPFEHGDNNMYLFTYYRNFTNDYDDNVTFGDFYVTGDWTQLSVNSDRNTHEVIGNIYENPELLK